MERRALGAFVSRSPRDQRVSLGGRTVGEWASVTAVISGLLATLLLAGSIHLTNDPDGADAKREWTVTVMAAGGLAAAAVFGLLLVARLIVELSRAMLLL